MESKTKQYIVGTCQAMCPDRELLFREKERLLHRFELRDNCHPRDKILLADRSKTVKEYSRAAAGKALLKPYELRPGEVLVKTVKYLLGTLIDTRLNRGTCWLDIYEYIFDRLRAVRQDMVIQNISGSFAIEILEKIVRFLVYSDYRLCEEDIGQKFDPVINNIHLQECLKRLLTIYKEIIPEASCNQVEFESLYQIVNLGCSEAINHYYELDLEIRNKSLLKTAYNTSIAYCFNNYVCVLREFRLFACIQCQWALHRHLTDIQRKALSIMSVAYSSKQCKFPVSKLTEILSTDSDIRTVSLCKHYSINVLEDNIVFRKGDYHTGDKKYSPQRTSVLDTFNEIGVSDIFLKDS